MAAVKVLACWNNPAPVQISLGGKRNVVALGVVLAASGVALMIIAALAQMSVISLNPQLCLPLGIAGGVVTVFAIPPLFRGFFDTPCRKACITALPLIALAALVVGSCGLGGHIPALAPHTSLIFATAGASVLALTCMPYFIEHPFQLTA